MRRIILSPAEIDRWLKEARTGDVLVYARAQFLPKDAKGPARMRMHAEADLVALCQRRADDDMFSYEARRTATPMGQRGRRRDVIDKDAVMDIIEAAASGGEAMPSEARIAEMLGHGSRFHVRRVLASLTQAGVLAFDVSRNARLTPRRVAILPESGLATRAAA